jgi:hypothetical protein
LVAAAALAIAVWIEDAPTVEARPWRPRPAGWVRWLAVGSVVAWLAFDVSASLRYHRALAQSGGLADHADASYHLAYYLRGHGLGAPIVLDWGIAAPVRYLSAGAVRPIEIFGYASPAAPDAGLADRLSPFLSDPANVYVLHTPGFTVFQGRRELFLAEAAQLGLTPQREAAFSQRDGTPVYEIWRVTPPTPP